MAHILFTADTPKDAVQLQRKLASEIILAPLSHPPKTLAGADVSLERFGTELFAGIVVLSYPDLELIEHAVMKLPVSFPYIPGLLSFRELPGLVGCFEKLHTKPDVVMVDGQGIAHPRRLGIATHLGLALNIPTIGCAKSRLYGSYVEPISVGETSPVTDPKNGVEIGVVLKSKARSNPLIISPGHLITLQESLDLVQGSLRGYRLPEPTRQAHLLVNQFRKGELEKTQK